MIELKNIRTLDTDFENVESLFKTIARFGFEDGFADTEQDIFDAMVAREASCPTAFVDGFAIPHGKSDKIKDATAYILKINELEWPGSMDGSKVTNVISLLIPEEGSQEHLRTLAKLATLLVDEKNRAIFKKGSDKEVMELVTNL